MEKAMNYSPVIKGKKSSKRYFKLYHASPEGDSPPISKEDLDFLRQGRYAGGSFLAGAKKIFSRLCRKIGGECTYVLSIQEVTEKSEYKIKEYRGTREKLAEPQKIKSGDVEYDISYKSTLTSMGDVNVPDTKSATR